MESAPRPRDYSEEAALAQRVARIFGYDGLAIDVQEGAGWATSRSEDGITLIVDPTMLRPQTTKDATGAALPANTQAPEHYPVYGIAHELGHVDDFMQPESDLKKQKAMKPSEHFFWNVLDDGVINNRLRNIPLLDNLTDEIYKDILFPEEDYTNKPKHAQFMYGWLFRNVTPHREVQLSDDVVQALDGLERAEVGKRHYDLYRTLAHPDTTYGKRREIAEAHILPIYQAFLEEDRQNREQEDQDQSGQQGSTSASDEQSGSDSQSGGQEGQPSNSADPSSKEQSGGTPSDWGDIYDAYANVSPCGHGEAEKENDSNAGNDDGADPHQAIEQAAEALKQRQEQADKNDSQGEIQNASQAGAGAGSIAAELMLSPEDALAYQKVVEQYRGYIHEVAKILQQLTVPSVEYTSPRYRRHADTSGLKLSPRDLFQVVVAQHSNVDPAVWKPVETISKREGLSFNGLDVHLLVDASGSMKGVKANGAATCSVMLMEGLAAARRMIQRYNPRAPKPDVRLQVILFGASAQIVAPLNRETKPQDKGITFTTVRDAASGSTLVSGALEHTIANAAAHPERTQLVYVITDGDFYDRGDAVTVLNSAGKNYFLYQYILLSPATTPITTQAAHLNNPTELPAALNKQLAGLASKLLL